MGRLAIALGSAVLVGCMSGLSPNPPTNLRGVTLFPPRGDSPPLSLFVPQDMAIQRSDSSVRLSRSGLLLDASISPQHVLLRCGQLSSCTEGTVSIDGRPANYIRYDESSGPRPFRFTLTVPLRKEAFILSASCASRQHCDFAERVLARAKFAEIALSY
jgi:hypothetical protein